MRCAILVVWLETPLTNLTLVWLSLELSWTGIDKCHYVFRVFNLVWPPFNWLCIYIHTVTAHNSATQGSCPQFSTLRGPGRGARTQVHHISIKEIVRLSVSWGGEVSRPHPTVLASQRSSACRWKRPCSPPPPPPPPPGISLRGQKRIFIQSFRSCIFLSSFFNIYILYIIFRYNTYLIIYCNMRIGLACKHPSPTVKTCKKINQEII